MPQFVCFSVIGCRKPKKGIKSSIGRLFGKKEKGRLEQALSRDGQPLPALSGTFSCPTLMQRLAETEINTVVLYFRLWHGHWWHYDSGKTGHPGREGSQDEEKVKASSHSWLFVYLSCYRNDSPGLFFFLTAWFLILDMNFWKMPGKEVCRLPSGTALLLSPG